MNRRKLSYDFLVSYSIIFRSQQPKVPVHICIVDSDLALHCTDQSSAQLRAVVSRQ